MRRELAKAAPFGLALLILSGALRAVGPGNLLAEEVKPADLATARQIWTDALQQVEQLNGYTATFVKKERVDGQMVPTEVMELKLRHEPFSVYLKNTAPRSKKGQEAIYVAGRNDGKIVAHTVGFKALFVGRMHLNPTDRLAMADNRYPITNIGLKNLCEQLVDFGKRDEQHLLKCEMQVQEDQEVNKRPCRCLLIKNDTPNPPFTFAASRLFIDNQLKLPVCYETYEYPSVNDKPVLVEQYTYLNLKPNAGLTDKDFDPDNPSYNYP